MEEGIKILSISELLQISRSLTGASSLHNPTNPNSHLPSNKKLKFQPQDEIPTSSSLSEPNPNPRILTSLKSPTLIIGTIDLPTDSTSISCGSNYNCFCFSDGSARVCCSILGVHLNIIHRKIRVLAWNFIPFKCNGGGFLEIIRWDFLEPISEIDCGKDLNNTPLISAFSPQKECPSFCSRVHGKLESVSPVLVVPCAIQSRNSQTNVAQKLAHNGNMIGFLAKILACECAVCKTATSAIELRGQNSHSFNKSVFVYFCGPTSSWCPVLSKLVRDVVLVTELKKKMICVGGDESYLMFVTSERSELYHQSQLRLEDISIGRTVISGRGESGLYMGTVTGVYMKGMVFELDKKVWLLVTDRRLAQPHFLRVGAIISLSNVHFVSPKFSWVKMLLLGGCFKTNIVVKSFSPLETQCHFRSQTRSLLVKFVESLTFSARFWVLLTVSCFRKKFFHIFSDKEILGSKNKEGLVHMFASSCLPSCVFRPRHGEFMEFCKHDLCGCCNEPNFGHLKLINPSSGRLQLVDATGGIDVVVPDLLSDGVINNIYEVKDYELILEGLPGQVGSLGMSKNEALSCRSIFSRMILKRELNQLTIYVHFYLRNATCLNDLLRLPCTGRSGDIKGSGGGMFHLLMITHKFPATHSFQGAPSISHGSSLFAEAIILPYALFLLGKNGCIQLGEFVKDKLEAHSEYVDSKNYLEKLSSKRPKIAHATNGALTLGSKVESGEVGKGHYKIPKDFCSPFWEFNTEQKPSKLSSALEIPCSLTVKSINNDVSVISATLFRANGSVADNLAEKPSAEKIMVEFKSGTFNKYQLLRIGMFYLMRCDREEHLCNLKDHTEYGDCGKALITSHTPMWSLSFSSGEVFHQSGGVPSGKVTQSDLSFQRSPSQMPETLSDVHLHITGEAVELLKDNEGVLEDCFVKPFGRFGEAVSVSTCIQAMLAEGNLISLYGDIMDVHSFQENCIDSKAHPCCERIDDIHQRVFLEVPGGICIHVYEDHHMVTIRCTLGQLAYPIGMGPGVNATFHRVLLTCNSRRRRELTLTPVSFIVINSIKEVNHYYGDGSLQPQSSSDILNEEVTDMVSLGLISPLFHCMENQQCRFRCRVEAIHILVLEKHACKFEKARSTEETRTPIISIPLAGFILDDGSSSCCCWADVERAATLLRLHEFTVSVFGSNCMSAKIMGSNKIPDTTGYRLEKMLKKHHRITVRNYGAMLDPSCIDFTFSFDSNKVFSTSDKDLVKFIIMNATCGSVLNVVGTFMDSKGIGWLEKELKEMPFSVQSMQNIWVREVQHINPVAEARSILQDLLIR
ncbi:conserved telomere maintenance component 1 isoform X2 [Tasmannia lanceolata]|uniref:conserved telomere maintenance component 1 isoform X2 n=1 Tax=Tasmannia lanceolata TaxID=3420 RepID=UPI0040643991